MIGETATRKLIEDILAGSQADQTEVVITNGTAALTRFANNAIHQNVAEETSGVLVRAVIGKRIGVASINRATVGNGKLALERALEIARHQAENPDFPGLPVADRAPAVDAFVEATAACSPAQRARDVAAICKRSIGEGLIASGAYRTEANEIAVGNSLGTFQYHAGTSSDLTVVVMSDTSSGYADRLSKDVREIGAEQAGEEAIDRALRGRNPRSIAPGEYTVILEPYAVSDLVDFLAYLGFSGLAVLEGRSFMGGQFGKQILAPGVTIWDDGSDPTGIPSPFDYEGVPRLRVPLITRGTADGVVYDSATAAKAGKPNTGHALPAGETFGAVPVNLFMAGGDSTRDELIAGTSRGLLVTRFWYTRPVHPLSVTVTGMTRDGLFLIENGEVIAPVKHLRFTHSYLEALRNVSGATRETALGRSMFAANRVPALRIDGFRFVSGTDF